MSDVLDPGKRAREAARTQEKAIKKQQQLEEVKLAEEESEVARRRALARPGAGGRSLLIATSPTGTTQTLGGS